MTVEADDIEKFVRARAARFTNRDPNSIGRDNNLGHIGLDSLDVQELVLDVEQQFNVDFENEDTPKTLAEFSAILDRAA